MSFGIDTSFFVVEETRWVVEDVVEGGEGEDGARPGSGGKEIFTAERGGNFDIF